MKTDYVSAPFKFTVDLRPDTSDAFSAMSLQKQDPCSEEKLEKRCFSRKVNSVL